jgi:predicted kinase
MRAPSRVTVLWGPPCSGKSTYIRERASGDDIVIDLDRLALALAPEGTANHSYARHHRKLALDAREAIMHRAVIMASDDVSVWVVDSNADAAKRTQWKSLGAEVVMLDTPREVCEQRAATERPAPVRGLLARWYAQHMPETASGSRDW